MQNRWKALTLDDGADTPLYLQLAQKLSAAIHAGWWQASEALPSERSFCDALAISRVTARKALDILLQQGLITRRHGSGTFITPRLEQPLSRLTGFSEMLTAKGFKPGSVWLSRSCALSTADEAIRLGLSPHADVCHLKRQRLADGEVMAIEFSTLPSVYLPDPFAIENSLYAYLDLQGHSVVRALQHVRAINASVELAQLARIPSGEAMLMMSRIGYDAHNHAIELTDTYCRNDYYDFVAELKR